MFARIQQFFAAPTFPNDPDKNRQAYLLNFVSLAYLLIVLVSVPLGIFSARTEIAVASPVRLFIGLYLRVGQLILFPTMAQILLRRREPLWGSRVFVYGLWLGYMLLVIFNGGVDSTAFPNTVLVMLTAALLLSGRSALTITFLTIVVGGISTVLDARGFLPDPLAGSNIYLTYISYSFIFIAI